MTKVVNEDVFSQILSHIYDSRTLYTISLAIPSSHPFFGPILSRFCQLPIPLDCDDESKDTDRVLDLLISSSEQTSTEIFSIADIIQHLVIIDGNKLSEETETTALRMRLIDLFKRTGNLQILDWYGQVGPSKDELHVLQAVHGLRTFKVDCGFLNILSFQDHDRIEDAWEIDYFIKSLGPNLTYLDLRKINVEAYKSLVANRAVFSDYHSLNRLSLDLTEGVWDWDGAGSPQAGASDKFKFDNLRFPALKEVDMRVGDLTISSARTGPMDLIDWNPLTSLSLFVDPCINWCAMRGIHIFTALPPDNFSSLARLEIQDTTRNRSPWLWPDEVLKDNDWNESGRCYWGIVPQFLASVRSGSLPNLVNLWVNQKVLCMPKGSPTDNHLFDADVEFYDIGELWITGTDDEENARKSEWLSILRLILGRLESLRVGCGPMSAGDVGLIIGCCSPDKLVQFGFQYKWQVSEREAIISSALLEKFALLPNLTDLHLTQPRPGSGDVYQSPLRSNNERTLDDIAAIFKAHPNLCRVGVGQNAVWERRPLALAESDAAVNLEPIILAQDGCKDPLLLADGVVPRFFDIGVLTLQTYGDVEYKPRPKPTTEIRELRSILERILPSRTTPGFEEGTSRQSS